MKTFHIEIDDKQYAALKLHIPWGLKRMLFSIIIDDLIKLIEGHGPLVIGAVLAGKVKFQPYFEEEVDE